MFTLLRLLVFPVKVGLGGVKLGVKAGFRTGRLLGYRRLAVFAAGVGVGLLVAPVTGREARARIRALLEGEPSGDLAERVRFELAHSPRTWHLPQPSVEVHDGTVVLRGVAPHESGREELERTAAAVAGVVAVDNHMTVVPGTNHTR